MNPTQMKHLTGILYIFSAALLLVGCSDIKRTRGREYMPDMAYSRAYETYAPHDNLKSRGINYNAMPVPGTVKRGEVFPFSIPKDKDGDSTNYIAARAVVNPLLSKNTIQLQEAERLFLINCAICHGSNLEGNGPLYNGGNGPYPAAPKNLVGDPVVSVMPEGQLFYSVTYGKGQMGPYGSQLSTSQRWAIVHYVKTRQLAKNSGTPSGTGAPESGNTLGVSQSSAGSGNTTAPKPGTVSGQASGTTTNGKIN